jgi:hypothetical protein
MKSMTLEPYSWCSVSSAIEFREGKLEAKISHKSRSRKESQGSTSDSNLRLHTVTRPYSLVHHLSNTDLHGDEQVKSGTKPFHIATSDASNPSNGRPYSFAKLMK